MQCPKCSHDNGVDLARCERCGGNLAVAVLEVLHGDVAEKIHFLRPRAYTLGRARHNDLFLNEPSISKSHAQLDHENGHFFITDQASLHGVYVNATKVQKAELHPGSQIQLGNVTLKFSALGHEHSTAQIAEFPWVEQQQLLLSLVQALNSTLVLNQVLEQVLDAVMRITRAERGFLLLADSSPEAERYELVAGLRLRVARGRGAAPLPERRGLSTSVVKRALQSGQVVATGNAAADPHLGSAPSVIALDLRTIVCIPLRSPRADLEAGEKSSGTLGALYVDNQESSAPFRPDSLKAAEALARHAALAIENALLFEREQRTIEELRQAQRQLLQSEKLAAIGQMAAGIAHELNTPLTYIMGNLELLGAAPLEPGQRDMLSSVGRGAERIKSLAQSLLAFSRPAPEEMRPLDLNELVERALELCHYQVLKSGVKLTRRLEKSLPTVLGVSNQLEMALINLAINAVHAVGDSGGQLTVATGRAGNEVEITVSDNGPGIPEAIRHSVFEPFVTTKPEGQGTGLGLSTVLMVVERHEGKIDFTTSPSGTTFRLRLPVAAPMA
jgi:signal transduction histidine kinase